MGLSLLRSIRIGSLLVPACSSSILGDLLAPLGAERRCPNPTSFDSARPAALNRCGAFSFIRVRRRYLPCRYINDPFGELIRVAGSLAFTYHTQHHGMNHGSSASQ